MITKHMYSQCLALATALSLWASGTYAGGKGPLQCDFSTIDSPMVNVRIENGDIRRAELRLPNNYIMSGGFRGEEVRETLLMRVWKDSFLPYTWADAKSKEQKLRFSSGLKDDLVILIGSFKYFDQIARMEVSAGNYDLPWNSPDADMNGVLLANGLYGQKIKPKPHLYDVFFARNGEKITDIISCSQIGDVPSPGCTHIFESGPFDLQIDYRRDQLDNWKMLRTKTAALVQCFTTKMPTQKPRN